jgi:2-succinyl-5-enolpyruvyl-6-hydroxy-3-cyclohexene-1-carboxylate synthase
MPTSKPLRAWIAESGAGQIVIDPYGGWNEPTNQAAATLRADPTELASGWAARLEGLEGRERPAPERWIEAEVAAQAALKDAFEAEGPISEPALHRALGAAHQDGDLVYTSSSMPIRDQEAFLPASSSDVSFLSNRGANGIDGLISSGIGAARLSGHPTTILTGDLGFLHDIGGLAALRDVSTPVRIVVIDNDGGGIFHFLPQEGTLESDEFEALLGTPRGVDVAKAAALFDLPHRRLDSLADLPSTLAAGTGLIEVKTNRRSNVEAHRRLAEAVSEAIGSLSS